MENHLEQMGQTLDRSKLGEICIEEGFWRARFFIGATPKPLSMSLAHVFTHAGDSEPLARQLRRSHPGIINSQIAFAAEELSL